MEWTKGKARDFSVGGGIGGENVDNGNGKKTKKKVDGQRKLEPERKCKGEHKWEDTKGRTSKKDNENGKSIILERSGFKKKRTRILGLCETTCDCGSGRNMDLGTELGKNRSCYLKSTNGNVKGQNEERKEEVLEVKLAIKKKRQEKGEEEGRLEKYVLIGNKWWKIMTTYSKEMKKTTRGVRWYNKRKQGRMYAHGREDFNGRIGERAARNWEEEREEWKRKLKN
jgi:hypothetical protein